MHLALLEELAQGGADGIRCRLDLLAVSRSWWELVEAA
jgi:hypothetical protein